MPKSDIITNINAKKKCFYYNIFLNQCESTDFTEVPYDINKVSTFDSLLNTPTSNIINK